jgi:hypothetical protein
MKDLLLEHQSKPDPLMSLRLYLDMGELWKAQRREERSLLDRVLAEARHSKLSERERVITMGMTVVEQWKAEGRAEAAREVLETALTARFGPLPDSTRQALAGADAEAMKKWLRRALTAPTLEAIGILAEE